MADLCFIECEECGQVTLSVDEGKVMEEAEEHKALHPEHQLFLHIVKSAVSRKL